MQQNTQRPEPFNGDTGDQIDLHSMFYTLQGEGPFTGYPSIFIRLAGCNLQCKFCDTLYTEGRQFYTMSKLVGKVQDLLVKHPHTKLFVITGGEPTRQIIVPMLKNLAFTFPKQHIQIESNGVLPIGEAFVDLIKEGKVSYIVSPKTSKVAATTAHATAFKYVLEANEIVPEDGLPSKALGHKAAPCVARPPKGWSGPIYVNPMDSKDPVTNLENLRAARDSALQFGYILGTQAHKDWDLP